MSTEFSLYCQDCEHHVVEHNRWHTNHCCSAVRLGDRVKVWIDFDVYAPFMADLELAKLQEEDCPMYLEYTMEKQS